MKKIVLYVLILILITFIIPFVFTKSTNGKAINAENLNSIDQQKNGGDENNIQNNNQNLRK